MWKLREFYGEQLHRTASQSEIQIRRFHKDISEETVRAACPKETYPIT
jgi:hypothetical protein